VLPAWERRQRRAADASAHGRNCSMPGALGSADSRARTPLAPRRREVHESLARIAIAAQRAQAEPPRCSRRSTCWSALSCALPLLAQLGGDAHAGASSAGLAAERRTLAAEHLARITSALEAPGRVRRSAATPIEARTETITAHEEAACCNQRLRDAADEARALDATSAAAQAWEAGGRSATTIPHELNHVSTGSHADDGNSICASKRLPRHARLYRMGDFYELFFATHAGRIACSTSRDGAARAAASDPMPACQGLARGYLAETDQRWARRSRSASRSRVRHGQGPSSAKVVRSSPPGT